MIMICPNEIMECWESCNEVQLADAKNYYTKSETDEKISRIEVSGITEEEAEEMIDNALEGYYSRGETDDLIGGLEEVDAAISGDVSDIEDTLDTYFKESAKVSDFDYTTSGDYVELNFPYYVNQGDAWDDETNSVQIDAATESSAGVMSASDKEKLNGLLKTWSGTQAEYDAITEKDNNTVYFIKED